ncbi:MAG: hypothetical protein R3C11_19970 [Planctomycetaceae bacterium]
MPKDLADLMHDLDNFPELEEENIFEYEQLVFDIASYRDPTCIGRLLQELDDESPYTGTMENILINLEVFPLDIYFRELFAHFQQFYNNSPEWAESVICSFLNSDIHYRFLLQYASEIPPGAKAPFLTLLHKNINMNFRNEKCEELVRKLSE